MVGTPTQWTSSSFSRSRRARNVFSSSFERANEGEQNGPAILAPSAETFPFTSRDRSVRGRGRGRGGGRAGAFSSRPHFTPSQSNTTRALSKVFQEDSNTKMPPASSSMTKMPTPRTPFGREVEEYYPYLESLMARQKAEQDAKEQMVDRIWPTGATHKPTQSDEDSDSGHDSKHEDDVTPEQQGDKIKSLEYELAVSKAQTKSFQEKLDLLMAKMEEKEELEKQLQSEKKIAQDKEEKEKAMEKQHKEEMRELERDKKSSCDNSKMNAMAIAYVKQYGRVKDTDSYERQFLPYMESFVDQENTPPELVNADAEDWEPYGETLLAAKKRKELYYFITNVIDQDVTESLQLTIRESACNDAQAIWKKMSKLLKRGETEGENKQVLEEMLKCTMASTKKNVSGYGAEILRYQNLMHDLGIPQSEKKLLIPLYLAGLAESLKEVRSHVETKVEQGELITLEEVMNACEQFAKTKNVHKRVVKHQNSLEVPSQPKKDKEKPSKNKKKGEKKEKQKAEGSEVESLKKQLALAMELVKQNNVHAKNVGPGECRYGTKDKCPRQDCKFAHKPSQQQGGARNKAETWCAKCDKTTNHTTEEHGLCWTCGQPGHRSFRCPSKFGGPQTNKGGGAAGKTTLFAGAQTIELNGQTWVAFQGNMRVSKLLPEQVLRDTMVSDDDLEKPVFKMPEPAMARLNEIECFYTSKRDSAKLAVQEQVRLPQPPHPQKKIGKARTKRRRARTEKTKKASVKKSRFGCKGLHGRKEPRGKETKQRWCKVKRSRLARTILRRRSKRNPAARWTMKTYFKLEWYKPEPQTKSQRRKANRRLRVMRYRRAAVVAATKEAYKKRDLFMTFKKLLVEEIAARKKKKTMSMFCKVLMQIKQKSRGAGADGGEWYQETYYQLVQTIQNLQSQQACMAQTILDSGAMANSGCSKKCPMLNKRPLAAPVEVVGCTGQSTVVKEAGEWSFPTLHPKHDLTLQNVLDVPGSHQNLVSVGCLDDAGMKVVFEKQEGKVFAPDGGLMLVFKKEDGLYVLPDKVGKPIRVNPQHVVQWEVSNLLSAHETLNHIGFNRLRALLNLPPESMSSPNPVCKACLNAKLVHGKQEKEGLRAAPRYGYRLHSDTSRKLPPSNVFGQSGIQRFQLTGDEFTGTLWIDLMHRKSDAKRAVLARIDKLNNELGGSPVMEHQTDGGTEYKNKWLDAKLAKRHVTPRNSSPYQKHENGWIEARMKLIQQGAGAMMWRGKAPAQDYPYALRHWIYLHDMMPSAVTGVSPYEKRVGIPSGLKPNKVQGKLFCACYAKVYVHGKLQRDAIKCIYLGKDPRSTGVLVRPIGGKKTGVLVRAAQAVKFFPDEFPYANPQTPRPEQVAGYNFDSDSDQGEEEINLKSDQEEEVNSEVESEEEQPSEDNTSEDETEDDAQEIAEEQKHANDDEQKSNKQKKSMIEPEDADDAPDGDIDGEDAWEIKEITDERKRKIGAKRYTQYKVVWTGDFPDQWLVKSRVRAPAVIKAWEEKKKTMQNSLTLISRRYCQLNMCMEPVTPTVLKDGGNPFKSLFDPTREKRPENPVGYKKMMQHQFADYFVQALIKEKMENLKWKAYVEVPRSTVPKGAKILRPMTAYQIKYNALGEIEKFKSRVCLDGSRTVVHEDETYEAIADFGTIRLLLCLATRYNMEIVQTDVKNFFLQARLPPDKQYYCEIPEGWAENDPKTHVAKVLAPWYGLKESAKLAGDQLAEVMLEAGMKENPLMPKVFWKWDGDDLIMCASHIDDAVWISTNMDKLNKTLDKIEEKFVLDRTYNPTKLLGVEIEYDRRRGLMKLHQGSYNKAKAKEMATEGRKNFRPARSPGYIPAKIVNPLFPGGNKVQATAEEIRKFQKKIGVHMWSLQSDPSSMYTVYQLAKHMLNPQKEHWEAINRLERYKFSNPEIGVVFRRAISKEKLKKGQNLDCLTLFADADLAGDQQDAKSTSGWCAHLGESGMFDWKSKKQTCVCQSSCESEIYSSKECTTYAIWIRHALAMMGFTFTQATPIAQDNASAIATCTGTKHHTRQRHFRMQINLLRDCCNKRITAYPWVPTAQMKGDLFNKMHQPHDHERLCELNGIHANGLAYISDEAKEIQLDGWTDKKDPTMQHK